MTSGGGFPLDQTFYQAVKGQVGALPALGPESTLLQVSHCGEGLGSPAYSALLRRWGRSWRRFLAHLASRSEVTELDQWELQMQCRVLKQIGVERLWFVSDGVPGDTQRQIGVTPILGDGDAETRARRAMDRALEGRRGARVAVIPDGPYTMLDVAR